MASYSELIRIPTMEDRIRYLQRHQIVGERTFGGDRYLNQRFYKSEEWKYVRNKIIIRDGGWDLAFDGYPVGKIPHVHHIVPITIDNLKHGDDCLFDPENLILCSLETHNEIHYGGEPRKRGLIERKPGDTLLW